MLSLVALMCSVPKITDIIEGEVWLSVCENRHLDILPATTNSLI